jgi:hypothetical protein
MLDVESQEVGECGGWLQGMTTQRRHGVPQLPTWKLSSHYYSWWPLWPCHCRTTKHATKTQKYSCVWCLVQLRWVHLTAPQIGALLSSPVFTAGWACKLHRASEHPGAALEAWHVTVPLF